MDAVANERDPDAQDRAFKLIREMLHDKSKPRPPRPPRPPHPPTPQREK